ncbi:glycosyltransferase family 39 protein [Myxococcota bacterium]|nr:glycosyltransferase family 39 protein [Myxococcota bacterium]
MKPEPGEQNGRLALALVVALALVPQLPFLDTAISLDGPVFVAVARQIVQVPLDPFGFSMLWDPTSMDVARFNRNPPLLSYYLAAVMVLFGDTEWTLHLASLIFPLTAALSFYGIARRMTGQGLAPSALLVATPAFVILSTAILLDVAVLSCMLLAIYALLRSEEPRGGAWLVVGALAGAASGLMKYVGFSVLPLLAAGIYLLSRRRLATWVAFAVAPMAVWTAWGAYTLHLYGEVHFLGAMDVVADKSFSAGHLLNKLASTPIYYGAALLFPILIWARAVMPSQRGLELAMVALLLGAAATQFVLPDGEPPRRIPLEWEEQTIAALGLAGAVTLWGLVLSPRKWIASPEDGFLGLWLVGLLVFTTVVNWHVNAADALLAAPPVLLLLFRNPSLRPRGRVVAVWVALILPFSVALASADAEQANHYRAAARRIASEIGDRGGARWFVGHWGLQHYLEAEGFQPVIPRGLGEVDIEVGDWVVSARNVSQIDVYSVLNPYGMERVWGFELAGTLPLRVTNGDAGAGFYSHHSGYTPFAVSTHPMEVVALGRVLSRSRR